MRQDPCCSRRIESSSRKYWVRCSQDPPERELLQLLFIVQTGICKYA